MKKLILPLAFLCITNLFAGEAVGVGSPSFQRREVTKPITSAVKEYISKRMIFKESSLKTAEDLMSNLSTSNDKQELEKIIAENKELKLTTGKLENDIYVVELGKFKITVEPQDYAAGVIRINNVAFKTNEYKSMKEFFAAIDVFVDKELGRVSYVPYIFNLLIPTAQASSVDSAKYKNILKINSAGVVYLTINTMAVWRNDAADLKSLLTQVENSVKVAQEQCSDQRNSVGITGNEVRVYGVLNTATRNNLQTILDKASGKVTEEKVLAGIFSKFSSKEQHDGGKDKAINCSAFLGPFAKLNVDFKILINENICPQVNELTSCLGDLYSEDKKISTIARNEILKKYSGERFESDTNFLDQIGSKSK